MKQKLPEITRNYQYSTSFNIILHLSTFNKELDSQSKQNSSWLGYQNECQFFHNIFFQLNNLLILNWFFNPSKSGMQDLPSSAKWRLTKKMTKQV